jgi:tetratricopeptide (TPR) repeat protein
VSTGRYPAPDRVTGTGPAHPDAERLWHFCRAVLGVLDAGPAGACPPGLARELARAIGVGVAEVAVGLRREVDALAAAAAGVRDLPTRYLSPPPAATALLVELDEAQSRAARVADALDALRDGSGIPHPALPAVSVPEPPPSPVDRFRFAPDETAEMAALPAEPAPPTGGESRQAASVFEEARRQHKRQEFARAEELYTAAIRTDPRFGPAYSRRGQVRLARGAVEEAVADFNAALALDETAAEAWWWRGDARAVAGRFDEAIADYDRALALRPDLSRARYNREVALRRKGGAVAPAPTTTPLAVHPPPPRSTAGMTGPTGPASVVGHLILPCPSCGETGEVPWDRLGKVFVCKGCGRRFGVRADGRAVELVEGPGGKLVEAAAVRERAAHRRKRRLLVGGVVLAAALFPALGVAGWRVVRPAAASGDEVELPHELEARVELFARGWLGNDVRLMRRLTTPTHERVLFAWYNRHRPPVAFRSQVDGTVPEGSRIEVTRRPGKAGQAVVHVRVTNPAAAPNHPAAEFALAWEERAGSWYFLPPAR